MSPGRLNIKTRLELETRVLAAALKISLQKGDLDGARLAHSELSKLMRPESGEDTAADAVNVTKPFVDTQSGAEPRVEPIPELIAEPIASPVAAPPVMGELVRSPLGTPGLPQPSTYQQPEGLPKAQQDLSSHNIEGQTTSPSIAQTEPAPIFAGPRAKDMPDVDFSLQSTDSPPSTEVGQEVQEPVQQVQPVQPVQHVQSVQSAQSTQPAQSTQSTSHTLPHLPTLQPAPPPHSNQPTASDALRRSIVNTPMRASASNMPAIRSIDENVLKSAGTPSNNDANQLKLSESLAKIEAAMNSGAGAGVSENHLATTSTQSEVSQENSDEEPSRPDHQYQGLYRLLGVSQMSPYEEIHRNFLRRVRAYIRQINITRRPEKLDLLHSLRKIWIAHDILTDPVTRTDYDFRDLGLRGDVETVVTPAPEDKQQQQQTNRTPTRIGELLQCAGLLEPAELQIACDMHKAMPEVQFGTFLVKQGFIGERDLESVLLGQKLLRAGVISVAQFQVAMELSQSRGHNIGDTLVERGYVTQDGLDKAVESIDAPPAMASSPTPRIVDAVIPPEPEHGYGQGLAAALLITDLVDFEPMDQSTSSSRNNALTELLGGSQASPSAPVPTTPPIPADPANPPAPPPAAVKIEQPIPTLNLSQAVPSWKDQLDWDSPDMVQESEPETAGDSVINSATPAELNELNDSDSGVSAGSTEFAGSTDSTGSTDSAASAGLTDSAASVHAVDLTDSPGSSVQESSAGLLRGKVIDLGHAAPSWKDQLDWDSPEESVTASDPASEATDDLAVNSVSTNQTDDDEKESDEAQSEKTSPAIITSENAPLSIMEAGQDALSNTSEPGGARSSHEITGDYDRYTAEDGSSHAIETDESSGNGDTTTSTTGHHVASFFDSEKEEQSKEESEQHPVADLHDDEGFLPGDDWVDIDPTVQMETAAHLQPITMDNLTLKQGRSAKKNKDKKKHK
jgi:hypothetical protein